MGLALIETLCGLCKPRHPGTHPPTCDAFPERIYLDIRRMHAEDRQRYPGDHGITFEPKDDAEETRARLARIEVPEGRRGGATDLACRIRAVYGQIAFTDHPQRWRFGSWVGAANGFTYLPAWGREAILAAEAKGERPSGAGDTGFYPAP
jgi:hypothetical protein